MGGINSRRSSPARTSYQQNVTQTRLCITWFRRCSARVIPLNSRTRRQQASGPAQGPPGTQSVAGPRTLRVGNSASVQVRGRKVQHRGGLIKIRRTSLAGSVVAMRAACRLMQHSCGSARHKRSAVRTSRSAHLLHRSSKVRLRRGYLWLLFLQALRHFCSVGGPRFAAVRPRQKHRKAFRAARVRPSRPLAQTVSVITDLFGSIRRRPESALPATDCAVSPASASLPGTPIRRSVPVRVHPGTPLDRQCVAHSLGPSRPRPRRPSSHPSRRSLPLLQGACSLPSAALQSPPPQHSRPPPRPRSTSFRALWHCQTLSRRPQIPRTQPRRLRDWTAP